MSSIVFIGNNGEVIWQFAVGVLALFLFVAVIVMGIEAIKRFLDAA